VFIAGMSEGLLPHALAKTPQDVEEERRMAYVAMTRAEDVLFVSSTSVYGRNITGVSPFIVEAGLLSEDEVEEVTAF
jgi:superfamily I DNA/RNA helicase